MPEHPQSLWLGGPSLLRAHPLPPGLKPRKPLDGATVATLGAGTSPGKDTSSVRFWSLPGEGELPAGLEAGKAIGQVGGGHTIQRAERWQGLRSIEIWLHHTSAHVCEMFPSIIICGPRNCPEWKLKLWGLHLGKASRYIPSRLASPTRLDLILQTDMCRII